MRRFQYMVQFSLNDISEFKKENENVYRCRVNCKFCDKSFFAKYKSHWVVSNIEAHLKNHVNGASRVHTSNGSQSVANRVSDNNKNSPLNPSSNLLSNSTSNLPEVLGKF